ncbi:RNA methyltransferase [Butyrivibrio sp. CB08]|uniref:RsmF rRNA methyltransferase first C-terminal domain-containing protein n=1 Tax=Butyrivibrio sp. CB08 TaxID=2364879 RepID=UPI000EA8C24A|nr:RsmF rRNA methyltransferase first C-terminal domain-containing protein [Butyrivibrio sp. CB08]RKM57572.1 RNA methyltransferase [Butyrivibrio sp. CB08]
MSNLPKEFLERMQTLFSKDEYDAFIKAFDTEEERYHALRISSIKCADNEALLDRLSNTVEGKKKSDFFLGIVPWEPKGYYYSEDVAPGKHPYHEAGLYYIQEPSAMAPVHFLDPKPGERILDLCAAPGGKSTQIADALRGEGLLVTNEINRERSKILSLNIERMGIRNAMVVSEDSGKLAEVFEGYFDKILVDAPCSGEGMFRKNEIALSEWSPDNVLLCAERQKEILDNAARMLLPGGRLVYSTCTFSPEENEKTISQFISSHEDFHIEEVTLVGGMDQGRPEWAGEGAEACLKKTVRLWPHKVKGEGHFLCVMNRDGAADREGLKKYVPGGRFIRAKKDMVTPFLDFAKEAFKNGSLDIEGDYLAFGDQLYLAPEDMPSPNGLKVLRPGLHLGEVKKGRFEPSHALALTISSEETILSYDIPSDSQDIRQYLNGQTIRLSSEGTAADLKVKKGWCLITTDGYSIGWAKLAGGMLKNHYPKGLRINY